LEILLISDEIGISDGHGQTLRRYTAIGSSVIDRPVQEGLVRHWNDVSRLFGRDGRPWQKSRRLAERGTLRWNGSRLFVAPLQRDRV